MNLRAVRNEGQPWFVAKDVCDVLEMSNVSMSLKPLLSTERDKLNLGQRGLGAVSAVNESGLYKLILRSRKPEAQKFQTWVTSVVLPALRKDGIYMVGEEKMADRGMTDDEIIGKALVLMQEKLKRLEQERLEMQPKAEGYDKFLSTEGAETLTEAAKHLRLTFGSMSASPSRRQEWKNNPFSTMTACK